MYVTFHIIRRYILFRYKISNGLTEGILLKEKQECLKYFKYSYENLILKKRCLCIIVQSSYINNCSLKLHICFRINPILLFPTISKRKTDCISQKSSMLFCMKVKHKRVPFLCNFRGNFNSYIDSRKSILFL